MHHIWCIFGLGGVRLNVVVVEKARKAWQQTTPETLLAMFCELRALAGRTSQSATASGELVLGVCLKGLAAGRPLPSTALRARAREWEKRKRASATCPRSALFRFHTKRNTTLEGAGTVTSELTVGRGKWRDRGWGRQMPSANFRKIKKRNGKVTTPLSRSVYHVTPRKPNIRASLGREHGKKPSKYSLNTYAIILIKQFELNLSTDFFPQYRQTRMKVALWGPQNSFTGTSRWLPQSIVTPAWPFFAIIRNLFVKKGASRDWDCSV